MLTHLFKSIRTTQNTQTEIKKEIHPHVDLELLNREIEKEELNKKIKQESQIICEQVARQCSTQEEIFSKIGTLENLEKDFKTKNDIAQKNKEEISRSESQIKLLNQKLDELSFKVHVVNDELEKQQTKLSTTKEHEKELLKHIQIQESKFFAIESDLNETTLSLAIAEENIKQKMLANEKLDQQIFQLKNNTTSPRERLECLTKQSIEAEKEYQNKTNYKQSLVAQNEELEKAFLQTKTELQNKNEIILKLNDLIDELEQKNQAITIQADCLDNLIQNKEKIILDQRQKISGLKSEYRKAIDQFDNLELEHAGLDEKINFNKKQVASIKHLQDTIVAPDIGLRSKTEISN